MIRPGDRFTYHRVQGGDVLGVVTVQRVRAGKVEARNDDTGRVSVVPWGEADRLVRAGLWRRSEVSA